ncbi:MAG: methyltransferase domain-containing protein [Betaproteobacteria bacterium]|nr:methyltransferase domain-containing protein [Betaproteobacteria bacterium]
MGFVKGNLVPLLKEAKQKPFYGSALLLGFPDVYISADQLQRWCHYYQVALDPSVELRTSERPFFKEKGCLSEESLFKSLGFQQISTMDYSQFEGAAIAFDLNSADVPDELRDKYDFIIDHGTLEHVFHLPNALNNIFKMLRVGGRVLVSSPASNFIDHGFYMFSPTLYFDYFTANRFDIHSIQVTQSSPQLESAPCFYADYEPGSFDSVSYGGLNNSVYGVICVAQKTEQSTGDTVPQQGIYCNQKWKGKPAAANNNGGLKYVLKKVAKRVLRSF